VSVLAAVILTACGASPATQPPSGIDGLTIPTPSPTPTDFVARVDNPWLPLVPGTRWTYRRYSATGGETLVATVLDRPHPVAGVDTTAVRWEVRRPSGRTTPLAVRWYAQDTAGNVWWFGQRVTAPRPRVDLLTTRSWEAGRHGAEAGLVMPAEPRVGDGYANAFQPGVVESHSTVVSLDATVSLPARSYTGTLSTRDLSPLAPIREVRSFYSPGLGLVGQQTTEALSTDLSLLRVRRP
jgi:hypothetical protein